MYVKGKNSGGHAILPAHPKKYHKPYRIRHFSLFITGVILVILSAFGAGYLLGQSDSSLVSSPAGQDKISDSTFGEVKSSLSYSFKYDSSVFTASGIVEGKTQTGNALKQNEALTEATLRPRGTAVKGQDVLSEFKINIYSDTVQFDEYKEKTRQTDDNAALAGYFAPASDNNFTIEKTSQSEQTIGSVKFQKTVYSQKPEFSGAKPTYSVVWTGFSDDKPVKIALKNLIDDEKIPAIYGPVFDTLQFGADASRQVLADTTKKETAFDVNQISPAVVKIYHFVCGSLVINGVKQGGDACDGGSGSGFFISGDGYIATSGHVVVLDAPDILVHELLNNPELLAQFTSAAGLSAEQRARSDVVAAVLAKIYDLPSDQLRIDNRREVTFAALGSHPLDSGTQEEIKKAFDRPDSDFIKKAEISAVNYSAKDLLVIEQATQNGFSASDVALIKININNSPFIRLADSAKLRQNDPLNLIGFPADADNQLTSNDSIAPSVTNGTISSIRKANGSSSLLFQSDADASEGNSGGPAINKNGEAFGLVTYRFKSGSEANAAKSYIRDIADLKALAESKNITASLESTTQSNWEEGLKLYKAEKYTDSLKKFREVQKSYPAHRLVDSYISGAQQGIQEGRDRNDPPYAAIAISSIGIGGILVILIASRLVIRHRQAHQEYKTSQLKKHEVINPA